MHRGQWLRRAHRRHRSGRGYRAVRERVGVLDFSMLYKIDVQGDGALSAINEAVDETFKGQAGPDPRTARS